MNNKKFNNFCIFYVRNFELIITINLLLTIAILITLLINAEKLIDFDMRYIVLPCGIYFGILFSSYLILKKKLIKFFKNKYIYLAFKNEYKNFSYNPNGNFNINLFDFLNSKEFNKKTQDNISGLHNGYKFNQNTIKVEIIYETRDTFTNVKEDKSISIFDGIITEFKLKNTYKKILIYTNDLHFDLEDKNMQRNIKIDNENFNNHFTTNATSKEDVILFLDDKMINTLTQAEKKLLCSSFFIYIVNNKLFIGQNCSSNLFDPNFKRKQNEQKIIKYYKEKMEFSNYIINNFDLEKEEYDY